MGPSIRETKSKTSAVMSVGWVMHPDLSPKGRQARREKKGGHDHEWALLATHTQGHAREEMTMRMTTYVRAGFRVSLELK